MSWERGRELELEADLEILLTDICENWDFCKAPSAKDLLAIKGPLTSKIFTDKLIISEGLDPANEVNWVRRIKRKFVQRYGHSITEKEHKAQWS